MKNLFLLTMLSVAGIVSAAAQPAATMSLVDARKAIGAAITDPGKVTATMKQLSPADQVAYVAALNAAIAKYPGSSAERAAVSLNVNSAAVLGASKGNLKSVVAEVFATASVESLPVIHTQFAEKFFNRAANSSATYTDAQFVKIGGEVMKAVNERVETVDNGDARSGFAALMFLKASNNPTAPDMVDAIVETLPKKVQETAKNEWIPAATSSEPTYDDMTAGSNETDMPEETLVITIAGPQNSVALFGDLTGNFNDQVVGTITDVIFNPLQNATAPQGAGAKDADIPDIKHDEYIPQEPGGYQWQRIH